MTAIPEGKPRDTLLKFDDPIESPITEDRAGQKSLQKGLPCKNCSINFSLYEKENSIASS